MATVTGLTAARMLEIEAASVVDGDVSGDDLILTRKDGSIINAGNVRGGPGPTGPMGEALSVVTAQPVLDVGIINQIRAGRQLAISDFTNMGLNVPIALWNLSNANDSSGNARHLSIKGSVPFGVGINGLAATAAVFAGATTLALYIDAANAAALNIKTGSWGCWMRSGKRGAGTGVLMGKYNTAGGAGQRGYDIEIGTAGNIFIDVSVDGASAGFTQGAIDVCDDRWHFVVATFDGSSIKHYVDSVFDAGKLLSGSMFASTVPFNIGGSMANAGSNTVLPFFGRVDEAFITDDVLDEGHIRNLMCASIPHALGSSPKTISMSVKRKVRGAALAPSDFPSQPLRLYNFTNGVLTDQGSNNTPVVSQGGLVLNSIAGADGIRNGAYLFPGIAGYYLQSSDANLPVGFAARSFGAWFKTGSNNTIQTMVSWGNQASPANSDVRLQIINGVLRNLMGNDNATAGGQVADAEWHFAVAVGDPADPQGLKHKLYLDGRLVQSGTTLGTNGIAALGAAGFHIGSESNGVNVMNGAIDSAFVCDYALTLEQIVKLYNIGSQVLADRPEAPEDHIEAIESARLLANLHAIETSDLISLAVSG